MQIGHPAAKAQSPPHKKFAHPSIHGCS